MHRARAAYARAPRGGLQPPDLAGAASSRGAHIVNFPERVPAFQLEISGMRALWALDERTPFCPGRAERSAAAQVKSPAGLLGACLTPPGDITGGDRERRGRPCARLRAFHVTPAGPEALQAVAGQVRCAGVGGGHIRGTQVGSRRPPPW